ncbi:MAG: TylF/MycF/NovP-related O-methyltransferase [Nocardioidaceae bacterium]
MTGREKLFGLILATRYIVDHDIPGDIVECGVWRGGSMQAAALTLLGAEDTGRHLHLFDTFDGMPTPTAKDRRIDGRLAADLMATRDRDARIWAVATLDDVKAGMAEIAYPQDQIHYHQGRVEVTIPVEAPETIAILRLDTDWYESTRHELEHLYERLSPGGVLIIDDYGYFEGSRLATDEFLKKTGARLLLLPINSGRIAVKP